MNQRHTEFFGADLGRGPFAPHQMATAAVQIASALAQVRFPVSRADDDLLGHGDFIRQLADRLAPDYAAYLDAEVEPEAANLVKTTFRTALNEYTLFECWLADTYGGGLTATAPAVVVWDAGTVVQTISSDRHFRVLTTGTGVAMATVSYGSSHTWYWAMSRHGRVFYSDPLLFT